MNPGADFHLLHSIVPSATPSHLFSVMSFFIDSTKNHRGVFIVFYQRNRFRVGICYFGIYEGKTETPITFSRWNMIRRSGSSSGCRRIGLMWNERTRYLATCSWEKWIKVTSFITKHWPISERWIFTFIHRFFCFIRQIWWMDSNQSVGSFYRNQGKRKKNFVCAW